MKKLIIGTIAAITLTGNCLADSLEDRIRQSQYDQQQMRRTISDLEYTNRILQIDIEIKLRNQQLELDRIKEKQERERKVK